MFEKAKITAAQSFSQILAGFTSANINWQSSLTKGVVINKLISIAIVFLFATSIHAAVTISGSSTGNTAAINYSVSGPNSVRAFALDISINSGIITDVNCSNPNYYIYPGSIVITSGSVFNFGGCVCDPTKYAGTQGGIGANAATVEMGSLYTGSNKPPSSGTLVTFTVSLLPCTATIAANIARGGIVMENPDENPHSNLPVSLTLVSSGPSGDPEPYSGGTGEPSNPYQIADSNDWQELMNTSADWNKNFILKGDIDLAGVSLTPVGNDEPNFTGVFNGNGHVIRNAVINLSESNYVGLFGYVGIGSQIKNLGVEDANITGGQFVGGLVAENDGSIDYCYSSGSIGYGAFIGGLVGSNRGSITACYSTGSTRGEGAVGGLAGCNDRGSVISCYSTGSVSGEDTVGGLVGWNFLGSITSCYSTDSVTGHGQIGGLVGLSDYGTITSCYSTGSVSGKDWSSYVGGLIGNSDDGGSIAYCYATGSVSGKSFVGGLVGGNLDDYYQESGSSITSCHSTGSVSGEDTVGGLVGGNGGSITACYAIGNVAGTWNVGGLVGWSFYESMVAACYATGSVSGTGRWVGGLVGTNYGSLTSCYAAGSVSGADDVGGFVGFMEFGSVTSSSWDTETSSQSTSAGGTGLTTTQMKTQNIFTDAGWDFSDTDGNAPVWMMLREGEDYPRLAWQEIFDGDIAGLYGVDMFDLAKVATHWLQAGCPTDCENADIDGSGTVDFYDFALLARNWLEGVTL